MKLLLGLASTSLLTGRIVLASPLTTIPGATFGGTGIPATDVEVTTLANGGDTITLGLTATPRYPNQPIGSSLPNDNSSATFFATPGVGVTPGKATWNFDYYISVNNGNFSNYTFDLLYGKAGSPLVAMPFGPVAIAQADQLNDSKGEFTTSAGTTIAQDSETLSFSFLGSLIGFDPNAIGQYDFELQAFGSNPADAPVLLGESDIAVDIGTVPDATSSVVLFGLGLASLFAFGYCQNRLAMAE